MALLFIEKVPESYRYEFGRAVVDLSKRLDINPNWLMALMNSETGGTFNPGIVNMGGSGATGLIQFMPATANWLGTSTSQLAKMSAVTQLAWVEKYLIATLKMVKLSKFRDYDDLYLAVFYPAAIGKPDDYVIPLKGEGYNQNKGIDLNKDGQITVADFKAFIRAKIPTKLLPEFTSRFRFAKQVFFICAVLGLVGLAWLVWWKKGIKI